MEIIMIRSYNLENDADLKAFNEDVEKEIEELNKEEPYTFTTIEPESLIGLKLRRDVTTIFDGDILDKDEKDRLEARLLQLHLDKKINCEIESADKWAFKISWKKGDVILFDLYAGVLSQESILMGINNNDYELIYGHKVENSGVEVKEGDNKDVIVGGVQIPSEAFESGARNERSFKEPFDIGEDNRKIVDAMIVVLNEYIPMFKYKYIVILILKLVYGLGSKDAKDLSKIILSKV
jgi:hypothetical protein